MTMTLIAELSSPATLCSGKNKGPGRPRLALLHHALVTRSPYALKFQGAAALQLTTGRAYEQCVPSDQCLIASPFNKPLNLLDLSRLEHPHQLLAKALTVLQPSRADYATAPYAVALNWNQVLEVLADLCSQEGHRWQEQSFYIVEFRSQRNPAIDGTYMDVLDCHSHEEAVASGGLLKYWFGDIDTNRRNLATCIWRSKYDAVEGGRGPWHQRAKGATSYLYENFKVYALRWTIKSDFLWHLEPWVE